MGLREGSFLRQGYFNPRRISGITDARTEVLAHFILAKQQFDEPGISLINMVIAAFCVKGSY